MTTIWNTLAALHPASPQENASATATLLAQEFLQNGYLRQTCTAMLDLSDATIIAFYAQISQQRPATSPVANCPNSDWMVDADFCFFNIRATGRGAEYGNFITAAKLLPVIRANAIHLGPFTDYDHHVIYAVRSVKTIDRRMVHPTIGIGAEDQLRAFVQACHLLGKTAGFDLEPHMTQFAKPVMLHPELFRWLRVPDGKPDMPLPMPMEEVLSEAYQQKMIDEVRAIVTGGLATAGLRDLEAEAGDDQAMLDHKQKVYYGLIRTLIDRGYWTIPSQSWAGQGVPTYAGYFRDKGYPRWDYRSPSGDDLYHLAFHALTPIKFYTGMLPNRANPAAEIYEPGVAYFCEIFDYWRDEFDFDFVRHDSADHIFDSTYEGDPAKPASDRPTPAILARLVQQTRRDKPYIGNLAERMGNELEEYAGIGYDLILGSDMFHHIDKGLLEKCFHLAERHQKLNASRPTRAAITFAVDTHDTGNAGLLGASLIEIAGFDGMRLRHFISRFLGAGTARRPKYEVMGAQDLSHGLFPSNIRDINLTWVGDTAYAEHYHTLEDIYEAYRAILAAGEVVRHWVNDTLAWWVIQAGEKFLVAAASLEFTDQQAVPPFTINLEGVVNGSVGGTVYDFSPAVGGQGRPFQSDWAGINVGWLKYRAFQIWVVG